MAIANICRRLAKQLRAQIPCLVVMSSLVVGCQSEQEEAAEEAMVEQQPTALADEEPEVTPEQKTTQEVEALADVIDMPDDYVFVAEAEISEETLEEQLTKLEAEIEAEDTAELDDKSKGTP